MAQIAVSGVGRWVVWDHSHILDVSDLGSFTTWEFGPLSISGVGRWTEWTWQPERRAYRHIGLVRGARGVS